MKAYRSLLLVACLGLFSYAQAIAQSNLIGINTSGTIFEIDPKTGTLTTKISDEITSFELGAIARKKDVVYYVAAPSGTSENAIYTANVKTLTTSHIDLDRGENVRALFTKGNKLYGVFYDGNTGAVGIYQINPTTGVTTLKVDLSSFSIEPVTGAISIIGKFYYMLVKANNQDRQLLRFKLSGVPTLKNIVTKDNTKIVCDRIKPNPLGTGFVCVASPNSTQVDICKLKFNGITQCVGTLTSIFRIGSGHTMVKKGNNFYVFGYAPGEDNNQRIVKFKQNGKELGSPLVSTLIIGARFGEETDEVPAS